MSNKKKKGPGTKENVKEISVPVKEVKVKVSDTPKKEAVVPVRTRVTYRNTSGGKLEIAIGKKHFSVPNGETFTIDEKEIKFLPKTGISKLL